MWGSGSSRPAASSTRGWVFCFYFAPSQECALLCVPLTAAAAATGAAVPEKKCHAALDGVRVRAAARAGGWVGGRAGGIFREWCWCRVWANTTKCVNRSVLMMISKRRGARGPKPSDKRDWPHGCGCCCRGCGGRKGESARAQAGVSFGLRRSLSVVCLSKNLGGRWCARACSRPPSLSRRKRERRAGGEGARRERAPAAACRRRPFRFYVAL